MENRWYVRILKDLACSLRFEKYTIRTIVRKNQVVFNERIDFAFVLEKEEIKV